MNAKTTRIKLTCESLGVREFEFSHAERILRMAKNGGWKLATEEYDFKNGNITRRNKGEDKGKPKKKDN